MTENAFHRWRAELTKHLSISNDEDFLSLIFAHNALQQGDHQTASLIFGKAISNESSVLPIHDPRRLYEWELETLVNEYLTTNSSYKWVYANCRRLNCRNPNALAFIVRILREFENEEFSHLGHDIRYELRRVINRQFEWQRGFFNKALLYRTAYLFDGPECRKYLEDTIGLTLDELSYAALSLFAVSQGALRIDRNLPTEHVGLTHRTRDLAFEHFSISLTDARIEARQQREAYRTVAYKPSILRKYPCIRLPGRENLVISPLPQLLMTRVTNGIYYDVVGGGGRIRNEIGRRFEDYCYKLLKTCLPSRCVSKEYFYKASHQQATPDILVGKSAEITTVFECKAVKMGFADKFAEAEYVGRGYDEIAKAIFQIWRFVSHCRQGLTKHNVAAHGIGVVLLLESWMTMVLNARGEVLSRAALMRTKDAGIIDSDCIPIAFVEIGDLENSVFNGESEFDQGLLDVASGDHQDWLLTSIPLYNDRKKSISSFPFSDLETVVPWWGRVSAMVGSDEAELR